MSCSGRKLRIPLPFAYPFCARRGLWVEDAVDGKVATVGGVGEVLSCVKDGERVVPFYDGVGSLEVAIEEERSAGVGWDQRGEEVGQRDRLGGRLCPEEDRLRSVDDLGLGHDGGPANSRGRTKERKNRRTIDRDVGGQYGGGGDQGYRDLKTLGAVDENILI